MRRWRIIAAAIASVCVLVFAFVHLPFVRTRVLSWAGAELARRGIRFEAARLDYNLFALTVGLDRVTMAAAGNGVPFLEADAVLLDLPVSAIFGALRVQSVEVTRPRVRLVQSADGSWNLPRSTQPDEAGPWLSGRLEIDRLVVSGLAVQYSDAGGVELESAGLTLALQRSPGRPLSGRLSMAEPARVRRGGRATEITTFDGSVSFDGETVSIGGLDVAAPEGSARVTGTLGPLSGEPRLTLTGDGTFEVERVASWFDVPQRPAGRVGVHARVDGPLNAPRIELRATSERVVWPAVGALSLDGRATLADGTAVVDSLRVGLGAGEVVATGRARVAGDGGSEAEIRWRNLDIGELARTGAEWPIRIAAIADGHFTLSWMDRDLIGARGRLTTSLREPSASSGAASLSGRIDLSLDDRRWSLTADSRIAGAMTLAASAGGRLEETLAASTIAGRAELRAAEIDVALKRLDTAGLRIGADALRGTATATVDLAGTIAAPQASGTVDASDLRVGTTGPGSALVRFSAKPHTLTLEAIQLGVGPNIVTGQAVIGLDAGTLTGQLDGSLPQLAALTSELPEFWRPEGSARLGGRLGGTLTNPAVELIVASDGLRLAGQTLQSVRSTIQLADRVVTLRTLEVSQGEGRLTAKGQYTLNGRRYTFDASGTGLTIDSPAATVTAGRPDAAAPPPTPVQARFDLRAAGAGVIDRPHAEGTIDFSRLDWGAYSVGRMRADVTLSAGRLQVQSTVPSLGSRVDATVDLDARTFAATAAVVNADLATLTRLSRAESRGPADPAGRRTALESPQSAPIALSGTVSLQATANGPLNDVAAIDAVVDLRSADAIVNGAPVRLERPASLRYQKGQIVTDGLDLRFGSSSASARGRLGAPRDSGEALHIELTGSMADLMPFARLAPSETGLDVSGAVNLRLQAAGPIETPEVTGSFTLSDGSLKTKDLPPVSDIAVAATYAGGRLEVTQVSGRWQGVGIAATARIPIGVFWTSPRPAFVASLPDASGPAASTLRLTSITREALAPFVDRATVDAIAGHVDLVATIEASRLDLAGVSGEVTLERAELEIARVPIRQASPTRLRLANRRLDVVSWSWTGSGSQLDVTGSVQLPDEVPDLNLVVKGAIDLRMLGVFVPDVGVVGQATVDLRATGPATDPAIQGEIGVSNVDVAIRRQRIAITGLQGGATLTPNRVQLRGVTASANGGEVRAEGDFEYGKATARGAKLTVTGRGMAFEIIDGLRTDVDADLTLGVAGGERSIGGRVTILRGDYRRRLRLIDLLGTGHAAAAPPPPAGPGALDDVKLDISVATADDIIVDNNYGRLELGSQLTVAGTLAKPVLAGRLSFGEGGRVFLGGRTYSVRRGTIAFTNPSEIEPVLDLALETRVQQDDITLEITGTPDTLDVSLRSPGLSQQDAVSLLLTGQPADESTVAYSDIAQGQLLVLLSGEILGAAGQAVGLDSVRVSQGLGAAASTFDLLATESNPDARLTISKYLSREVELIVSQNLRETGDITWILAYRPTRRIDLRATTDDDDSRTYEFRHEVPFGGGRSASEARRPARPSMPRVNGVEVRGAPATLAADLRGKLRVEAGDRFDFYRWQEDRDRLVDTLHERGYLEARVAARRRDAGAAAIILDYDITPGPRTTLEVEGFTLPVRAIAQMKAAWTAALFDEFLKEDLAIVAKRALVAAGHLTPEIVITVRSPAADEKSVLVRMVPGPRFDERRLSFEGNTAMPSAALAEIVRVRDLEIEAWLDRDRLASTLEEHYRSLGYLSVTATVESPVFKGASAILPVRIEEGPLYRVGEVSVDGAAPRSADEVRATFGLAAGSVYRPAAVEPARRKVETDYLSRGHNKARVRTTVQPDRAQARVDLSLTIDAGPQQVLESVDVSGAGFTSKGTIDWALKLPIGQPIGLGDVYKAQKRLYDTGVFQSVDLSLTPVTASAAPAGVQPVRATVTLRELPRFRLRYGFRLTDLAEPSSEQRQVQPGLVTDLLDRNLFGRAITGGIAGQIDADRTIGRAFLSVPSLLGHSVITNVFLTQSREEIAPPDETAFIDKTRELTIEQKLRPAKKMSISYGLGFGRKHVYEPDADPDSPLPPLDLSTNITRATGTYAWDTRDDPTNASRGWFHSSGIEYGVEALGSDLRFIRYLAQQYYFKRVSARVVLASALRVGAGRGFDQELIRSERFFAGGGTSVRGFAEDGLGPHGVLGGAEGGDALLVFNQELRLRPRRWLGAVAFFDAGNVFARPGEMSFSDLEVGAGAGVRFISPFAILRVDFGVPLTSKKTEPRGRWYFGIGHTF